MKKNIVIFDLDGTICLNDHRQKYVDKDRAKFEYLLNSGMPNLISQEELELAFEGWRKDWPAFNEAIIYDTPNEPIVELYRYFIDSTRFDPYEVYLFTGRFERYRQKTIQWFNQFNIPIINNHLWMRSNNDHTDDHTIKEHWMKTIGGQSRIFCVFEDRQRVVDMWRSYGITCLQVASGNF